MHWKTLSEFLAMGGYAFYVWGSFSLTAIIAIWEVCALRNRRKQAIQQIRQQIAIEEN